MSDVALFVLTASIGFGIGLVCRRNHIRVLPKYYDTDIAVVGKQTYYKGRY